MVERIRIHRESLANRKEQLKGWKFPQTVKHELLRFLDDLGLGKVNRGKRLSPERQLQYLNGLRVPLESFNKSTTHLTMRDVERFEKALASGQLCNKLTGRPYAHNTQVEMRKLLKIFLRWSLGPARALTLAGWLDIHPRPKTPDFLKESEVERLYKHCRNARQRFLIAVLFDSGARAEEFHNIRFEDVHLPEGADTFVRITLKQEYSKTLGRAITLYHRNSMEAVKDYVQERVAEGVKPTQPIFRGDYTATRKFLHRLGQKVLRRPIHYHLFRHSSATYYATRLNRQELCYRYGWRFSSDMPDVYISRAGMETKALDQKFTQTQMSELVDQIKQLEQNARIKDERIQVLQKSQSALQENIEILAQVLRLKPSLQDIETALARTRRPLRSTDDQKDGNADAHRLPKDDLAPSAADRDLSKPKSGTALQNGTPDNQG